MNRYIDMHCHILPGIDDGAKDMEETKAMLRMAYDDGIRYIVVTPHYHPRRGHVSVEVIRRQLALVREEAAKIDENFRLFLGQEVYFGQDIPDLLAKKELVTLNCREYVLIEFSASVEEGYIKQAIQQLQVRGYKVILAHVERYQCVRENMDFVMYLYNSGVLFQVNVGSIIGDSGRACMKFVRLLLNEDMVFCVGTDAHDCKKRPPHMHKAARYVEKKYGEEYARRIFFGNAAMLLKKQR